VSIAFPVNVAEATLVKQADHQLWCCRHSLRKGLTERSKLPKHAYAGHRLDWDEAKILEIGSNSRYRKYKESACMAYLTNLSSQPSLEISPVWILLVSIEAGNS
jgi:hypothetical protein